MYSDSVAIKRSTNMKYLVLLFCLIVASYADTNQVISDLMDSFKKAGVHCKIEAGATEADITTIKSHQIPTTTTGKCFLACIEKKLEFMTEDGKFNKDTGYNFIAKLKDIDADLHGKFMKLADTCYAEVAESSDACETAANMLTCYEREREANGIPHWEL